MDFDISSPLTYGTPSSRVEGTPRSGARGTPIRQRADLGSVRKTRQVDLHFDTVGFFIYFRRYTSIYVLKKWHSLG